MTVSFTTNRTPSPAILAQVMRALEATTVQVQEDAPAEEAHEQNQSWPTAPVSDRFRWRASRARTTDLGGKSASQLCIEDREDDWR
jgi:hypothetical protein